MDTSLPKILLVPTKHFLRDRIFGGFEGIPRNFEIAEPFRALREKLRGRGFELKTIDMVKDAREAEGVVFFEMPNNKNVHYKFCIENKMQDRMFLIVNEPHAVHLPNHNPMLHGNFKRVLTWNDDLVDSKKYFKFDYMIPIRAGQKIRLKRIPFKEKKLLCLISSNKFSSYKKELYSERVRAIRFMEKHHPRDFDLYGVGWDLPVIHSGLAQDLMINAAIQKFWPRLPGFLRLRQYPSYAGTVDKKSEVFPKYKFTVCYENELGGHGYITEKILEALLYGCVPVYLGDFGIEKRIPKDCFVDKREYPSYEKLYEQISGMGEKEHSQYLNSIERFLNSKAVYPFTIDAFLKNFETLVFG
ncbi:MAG: glycosyltransferase family 10 [Candidatus Micrarchaeota archaeon]